MSNWTMGYRTEIPYIASYFEQLSPSWLELCLLTSGVSTAIDRKRKNGEEIRYLELGCGYGWSLIFNGATHHGEFWGNDFNPNHTVLGQNYAQSAHSNIHITQDSFEELRQRKDLTDFDVIVAHGVYSWMAPEVIESIHAIVKEKLVMGGVFYVSYNCGPGWASASPLRHIIDLQSRLNVGASQSPVTKLKSGIELANEMIDAGATYFQQTPHAVERLKSFREQNENYLVHEYLNKNWHMPYFEDVYNNLSEAKLTYATSADILTNFEGVVLSPKAKEMLANCPNNLMRESLRDYMMNTMFRKDIWVKGSVPISPRQRLDSLRKQPFSLIVPPASVPKTMRILAAEITLQVEIYEPIVAFLAKDNYAPKCADEIIETLPNLSVNHIVEALLILTGLSAAHPTQNKAEIAAVAAGSRNLNAYIMQNSLQGDGVNFMASPVLGSATPVNRFEQLFLKARQDGAKTVTEMAEKAWGWLKACDEQMVKEGKTLEGDEENLAEMTKMAEEFSRLRLPILTAMQIG